MGAISPFLTFAALFQQKEWRLDRLREHLRREGVMSQLFGKIRPWILLLYVIGAIVKLPATLMLIPTLLVFAGLTVLQLILRKQRMPRWTTKAMVITCLAFILFLALSFVFPAFFIPLFILLSPFFIFAGWALLLPLDYFLKRRIFARARTLRGSLTDPVVIGIAGSVGKTTTKELLHLLLKDLSPLTTPKHVNSELGVAQWFLSHAKELEQKQRPIIIVEMGAYRTGEIALLCSVLRPTMGIVTALGSDHLALFGSEAAIVDANAELAEALPESGTLFLQTQNIATRSLSARTKASVFLTPKIPSVTEDEAGLTITVHGKSFTAPLHGTHNAENLLLAILAARSLHVADERIQELLQEYRPMEHTFHVHREGTITVLDDTYNISPLSFKAALAWARSRNERPRVLLTSGLQETGAEEGRFLRDLGREAKDCCDRVLFTTHKGTKAFTEGYGRPVEILSPKTVRIPEHSLLVCIGRMPASTIRRLLP